MNIVAWSIAVAVGVALLSIGWLLYLGIVLAWEDARTRGLAYYGLPPEDRAAFKDALGRHARLLSPVLRLVGRLRPVSLSNASFRFDEVAGPRGTCSPDSFERGSRYEPSPDDVFVVTQMKSGTTWMQHLVYQVLNRGAGDLVETGRALYAVSPWLESTKSVSVDESPLVGDERPSRLIKTHFPIQLCPFRAEAKYIYVVRHPVSCFASCVDFIRANLGAFAPELDEIEAWFCSDDMWWGAWPDHVANWHAKSSQDASVLYLRFEDMKADLPGVAQRVATLLGVAPLTASELESTVHKCGFEYMSEHRAAFEMHPPHLLAVDAELFVKGTSDRHRDAPSETRRRIIEWCARGLRKHGLELHDLYDLDAMPR